MSEPKLEIRGVQKSFGRRHAKIDVLHDINLAFAQNEFVAVVGASGCGKSTLLSIVAGLEDCDSGSILLDGIPTKQAGLDRGVVFQNHTLLPWLSARQNIEFALKAAGFGKLDARQIADEHLELVNLTDFANRFPVELSGGMKQRVAIARSLSYRPKILLMDEPFGALDAMTRRQMQALLTRVWDRHRLCVLFVTHDVEEAVYLADRIVVMAAKPGRVTAIHRVALPRPRDETVFATHEFIALQREVLSSIRSAPVMDSERMPNDAPRETLAAVPNR
jgi:NitT/TauT family transport system ATP-binding protein